ncbi:uncharacterized protein LOC129751870 [Uranotaenia lowii]|uniref:uncharacterized protein LOC129751870 n=1 Tax=Uranotaenia lowii TaxID=190385 RepID=UPI0024783BE5|nr:uncharacterized protein LOC129751870 [Uranotaenia lowii]
MWLRRSHGGCKNKHHQLVLSATMKHPTLIATFWLPITASLSCNFLRCVQLGNRSMETVSRENHSRTARSQHLRDRRTGLLGTGRLGVKRKDFTTTIRSGYQVR